MDVHRLRNLTFLMSLGGISAACFSDKGPHDDGAGPGPSTGGSTDATTGGVDPGTTTDADDATTTTTSGAVDTTGATSEPATTTTTTGPDGTSTEATTEATTATTGPGPDSDVCMQYGTTYITCYPRLDQYLEAIVEECEAVVETGQEVDGPACGKAFEDFYSCLAALDCQQLEFEFNQSTFCAFQREMIEEFCPISGQDF